MGTTEPRREPRGRGRGRKQPAALGAAKGHRRAVHRARASRPPPINLARALAKRHLTVVAFDDGPFTRRQRYAPLAAVAFTTPGSVEALALGRVRVDGLDATDAMLDLLHADGFGAGIRAIVLDGISVGGFNVVDLDRLSLRSGLPVVSVTRKAPDFGEMRAAIRTYFAATFRRRWSAVRAHELFPLELGGASRFAGAVGCSSTEAIALLRRVTSRGGWPEPLRIARLLAHADARPRRRSPTRRRRPVTLSRRGRLPSPGL